MHPGPAFREAARAACVGVADDRCGCAGSPCVPQPRQRPAASWARLQEIRGGLLLRRLALAIRFSHVEQYPSVPRRACARVLTLVVAFPPIRGVAERREAHFIFIALVRRVRVLRSTRSPLGAPTVAIFGRGPRFRLQHFLRSPCSDAPRSPVVVPSGRGPGPPEAAVASRHRGTPLPTPTSRTASRRRPSMSRDGGIVTMDTI